MVSLEAERVVLPDDPDALLDWLADQGMGDGLPVIPPTPERVERMLAAWPGDPQELIAEIPPIWGKATVEKIAINAVMAGCKPEYFPVVVAAIEALGDEEFDLYGVQATTNPVTPLVLINGPARRALDVNCEAGALSPGRRANATIGRVVRLIMINVGGAQAGVLDKSTLGQPGKYTMCMGENEEASPWEPLHVERGYAPDQSVVTLLGVSGMIHIVDTEAKSAKAFLTTLAGSLKVQGSNNMQYGGTGTTTIMLCPEYADVLAQAGYSKNDVKRYVWENGTIPLSEFSEDSAAAIRKKYAKPWLVDGLVRATLGWENMNLIVVGGPGPHCNLGQSSAGLGRVVSRAVRY